MGGWFVQAKSGTFPDSLDVTGYRGSLMMLFNLDE